MAPLIIYCLKIVTLPGLLQAQTLDLHQALDLARQSSPEVQRAASAREEAHWKKIDALSTYLPVVTAGADHLLDKKLSTPKLL